jgi:hypothetical protein
MKLSWGYKILFGYLLFVAGIVFLVVKASNEKFDLVTNDYYDEELKYQQVIDQASNASALSAPVSVEKTPEELKIIFPDEMKGQKKVIDFYLYFPADVKKDFRKTIDLNENILIQALPAGTKGLYELKLTWTASGVKYYHEQKIFF